MNDQNQNYEPIGESVFFKNSYQNQLKTIEQRKSKREDIRSKIALSYVIGFFTVLLIVFYFGLTFSYSKDQLGDLLVVVSGILSGPLGFIIGFYFKDNFQS